MADTLDPNAMSASTLANVLASVCGDEISEQMIRSDLADGAPTNDDGTINIVHYTAWLAKDVAGQK